MEISIKQLSTSVVGDKFKLSSSQCKVKLCVIFQLQLPSHPTSDTNLWWCFFFFFFFAILQNLTTMGKMGGKLQCGDSQKTEETPQQTGYSPPVGAGRVPVSWQSGCRIKVLLLKASQHDLSPSRAVSAQREVSLSLSQCKGKQRPLLTFR